MSSPVLGSVLIVKPKILPSLSLSLHFPSLMPPPPTRMHVHLFFL